MSDVLVDTDVVSFFFKHDSRAERYESHLVGNRLFLCFVTVGELYRWAFVREWGQEKWDSLRKHIRGFGVLGYDDATAYSWARLSHEMQKKGRRMEVGDAWIAATALRHNMAIVTNNSSHFQNVENLQVITEAA